MTIRTLGDLKRHLAGLDLDAMAKRLAAWLNERLKTMPPDLVAVNLEWDLVGGVTTDEVVADLFGYRAPGLDPSGPGDWDWTSAEQGQYQFLGLGAIWSEAVEILPGDQSPEVEEAVALVIGDTVRRALESSSECGRQRQERGLRFFWARHHERPQEHAVAEAAGSRKS